MTPEERTQYMRPADPLWFKVKGHTTLVVLTGISSFRHVCTVEGRKIPKHETVLTRTHADGHAMALCEKCNTLYVSSERGDEPEEFRRPR